MTRYFVRIKTYNRFKTMGFDLICKICREEIKPFDEIESKASGKGPKLYHGECYDEAHMYFDYSEEELYNILREYGRRDLEQICWEFDEDIPEGLSDEEMIDHILTLQIEWEGRNL